MTIDAHDLDEDLRKIVNGVVKVMLIMDETNDASLMMHILASSTATVLCSRIGKEEEAIRAHDLFLKVINAAMDKAIKSNLTMWVEGTAH